MNIVDISAEYLDIRTEYVQFEILYKKFLNIYPLFLIFSTLELISVIFKEHISSVHPAYSMYYVAGLETYTSKYFKFKIRCISCFYYILRHIFTNSCRSCILKIHIKFVQNFILINSRSIQKLFLIKTILFSSLPLQLILFLKPV